MQRSLTGLRALALASLAVVGMASAAASAQNLLANPGFELPQASGPGEIGAGAGTDWTPYGGTFLENNNLGPTHEGNQYIKTFGGGSGAFQDVAVTPGQSYTASAWGRFSSADPRTVGSFIQAQLLVIFRDPTNTAQVGSTQASLFLQNTDALDVWKQGTLTGTVPAGVGFIRFQLLEQSDGNGIVVFDDNSLTVPEPASLGLAALGGAGLLVRRRRNA